ncbi:NAD(P)/FAD-dependent oxidoreductase [Maribacter sp. 4G9]|uniref:NAD(P)/FAD-dependent oxidoreductase n=1 Tax=Maribacter sp. 4G9 TaxID=1889777 RepID=UPI000C15C783|nr:FAD-dependent oxidoreductase [Maribacter sp. 4G9]PIB26322.1 amino acid dehydrogenase [Maribacter sp. 4G9]
MAAKKKTLIIGAGIMGLCSAYYLHKKGHQVTVLEKSNGGQGASFVNAGYLTPSHIVPMSAPGVITKGLSMMMDSKSPFYIKPRWDTDFFKWAWAFHKSSTQVKVDRAAPIIKNINLLSSSLYDEIKESRDLGDFHLEKKGLLMIYQTDAYGDAEKKVAATAKGFGLEVSHLETDELKKLHGDTEVIGKGALHYFCDSHTTPTVFMAKMKEYLLNNGVRIKYGEAVTNFDYSNGVISKVQTEKETFHPDNVVLASGSWSNDLVKQLGITLQVQAGKGYCIDVHRPTGIKLPAILMEAKVAITPMAGFTRFAGTMEFSGVNYDINLNRVEAIAEAVKKFYPSIEITQEEIKNAKCGLRPVSPDGLPYIGKSGHFDNLFITTGHAMMGWSLGPATGKLISEVMEANEPSMDISPFDPDRSFG